MFGGQTLGQALQAMPADRIDRIEVMTNPAAEFRAAGTGGIINLITKKAAASGWTSSVRLSVETQDRALAGVNFGYSAKSVSITGSLTYRHTPESETNTLDARQLDPAATGAILNNGDLGRAHWNNDYWQGAAAATYDLDPRTRLSGSVRLSTSRFVTFYADQFAQGDVSTEPTSAQVNTSRERWLSDSGDASITWRRTYGESQYLTLNAD